MRIPYIKNDSTEMIEYMINPEENMEMFISANLLDNPSELYEENCIDMCNISTMMIGKQLNEICEKGTLIVHEGVFNMMGNHTWLEVEGIIIDATLQQFMGPAKKLSLIDSKWNAYQSVKQYKFDEWVNSSPNVED